MKNGRLFELLYLLVERRALTAGELAERFEVSERTIYRDVDALSAAGVPVYTQRGQGGGIRLMDQFVLDRCLLSPREQDEVLFALRALLSTVKTLGYDRVVCAFQPHTYSRTKELFDDFVEVLQLPDKVLLAEIFAARETDTLGISSKDLADRIPGAEYCPTLEDVTDRLAQLAQPGDLLLTVGAGDIHVAGERLLERTE